mgnify:CR=1 FL=1
MHEDEPWHIIDLDPWAPAPAATSSEEFDMPLTQADYDAIAKAVWAVTVNRSGTLVPAIQELADAKSNAMTAPDRVWARTVKRAVVGQNKSWDILIDAHGKQIVPFQ